MCTMKQTKKQINKLKVKFWNHWFIRPPVHLLHWSISVTAYLALTVMAVLVDTQVITYREEEKKNLPHLLLKRN